MVPKLQHILPMNRLFPYFCSTTIVLVAILTTSMALARETQCESLFRQTTLAKRFELWAKRCLGSECAVPEVKNSDSSRRRQSSIEAIEAAMKRANEGGSTLTPSRPESIAAASKDGALAWVVLHEGYLGSHFTIQTALGERIKVESGDQIEVVWSDGNVQTVVVRTETIPQSINHGGPRAEVVGVWLPFMIAGNVVTEMPLNEKILSSIQSARYIGRLTSPAQVPQEFRGRHGEPLSRAYFVQ